MFSETGLRISWSFQVSEKVPELYELLEDIVELGGWVEPDVPWPKLVYLQVKPLFLTDCIPRHSFNLYKKSYFYLCEINPLTLLDVFQMSAAAKSGHTELALSLSRGLVTTLSGSSAENTLQLYRYLVL